tara:strand:- start:3241 stop:3399 length:159 start_codon:yes stop_codon:yes gene_type:complete
LAKEGMLEGGQVFNRVSTYHFVSNNKELSNNSQKLALALRKAVPNKYLYVTV